MCRWASDRVQGDVLGAFAVGAWSHERAVWLLLRLCDCRRGTGAVLRREVVLPILDSDFGLLGRRDHVHLSEWMKGFSLLSLPYEARAGNHELGVADSRRRPVRLNA